MTNSDEQKNNTEEEKDSLEDNQKYLVKKSSSVLRSYRGVEIGQNVVLNNEHFQYDKKQNALQLNESYREDENGSCHKKAEKDAEYQSRLDVSENKITRDQNRALKKTRH